MDMDSYIVGVSTAGATAVSTLRANLLAVLEQADLLQLDFVGIKISEALDALETAESKVADC